MRAWSIPVLGAVVISLIAPAPADARPRFGPGAVLGVFTGMLGGFRPSFGHHRRSAARHSNDQRDDTPRAERRPAATANLDRTDRAGSIPDRSGGVFWPTASADLVEYIFFPKGRDDRFWAYGIGAIVDGAFTTSDSDDARVFQARASVQKEDSANKDGVSASPAKEPDASAGLCGNEEAAMADALIERLEQTIQPREAQRAVLEQLRAAVTQAVERIKAACPAAAPASPAERLKAIEDRIWAMRNALLALRLPFETFYESLSEEQHSRLHGGDNLDGAANAAVDPREPGHLDRLEHRRRRGRRHDRVGDRDRRLRHQRARAGAVGVEEPAGEERGGQNPAGQDPGVAEPGGEEPHG